MYESANLTHCDPIIYTYHFMAETKLLRTDDWREWLRTISLEQFHQTFSAESLLRTLTAEDLIALSENELLIEYIAKEVLPQAEDNALRGGKKERPEAPIYALIGRENVTNVNNIVNLEGDPIRTRKAEGDNWFKATERIEVEGALSSYLHDVPSFNLPGVISEIIDVTWNLIKLRRINERYSVSLYNRLFADILGFSHAQYFALVVAKYHGRNFKGGKDLTVEETTIRALLERFGEPTKQQLDKLSEALTILMYEALPAAREKVEADFKLEQFMAQLGLMAQAVAQEVLEE